MPGPDFRRLERELLRLGIAPGHVARTVGELADHFDDLVDASLVDGLNAREAEEAALERFGDVDDIVYAMEARPELRGWAWRWPKIALLVYPLACIAALPAAPVIAGVHNAPLVARWTACLLLSGLVTATMFLVLQLLITLT